MVIASKRLSKDPSGKFMYNYLCLPVGVGLIWGHTPASATFPQLACASNR